MLLLLVLLRWPRRPQVCIWRTAEARLLAAKALAERRAGRRWPQVDAVGMHAAAGMCPARVLQLAAAADVHCRAPEELVAGTGMPGAGRVWPIEARRRASGAWLCAAKAGWRAAAGGRAVHRRDRTLKG